MRQVSYQMKQSMRLLVAVAVHLVSAAIALSLGLFFVFLRCILEYKTALVPRFSGWLFCSILLSLMALFLQPVAYVLLVRFFTAVLKLQKPRVLTLALVTPAVFVAGVCVSIATLKYAVECRWRGVHNCITNAVTAAEIMQWRQELMSMTGKANSSRNLQREEVLESILRIEKLRGVDLGVMWVSFDEEGRSEFATIGWGGTRDMRGLIVELNGQYRTEGMPGHFGQWTNGVYTFVTGF